MQYMQGKDSAIGGVKRLEDFRMVLNLHKIKLASKYYTKYDI